jgi:PAP2 superfamily
VLHTMVHLAVYDAVVAIEGGYEPFGTHKKQRLQEDADVRAAVATAAYLTARARVAASQFAYLDQEYAGFMANLPEGLAKTAGISVGMKAAAAIVERRASDGFNNVVLYQCSEVPPPPGEFDPDSGCPANASAPQPVDVKVGQITPYTFSKSRGFAPRRPLRMTSKIYAADFNETRDYGRIDSVVRTTEQTDIAFFWSENPYVHWNRNLTGLALAKQLDVLDTARLFAMVQTAVSDAVIVGFDAKYRYGFWRPRTAIPQADADRNDDTDADPSWRPLLSVNHPEYPSGHGFWSTALIDSVARFFGTSEVTWTLTTSKVAVPRVEQTSRTYTDLETLKREIFDARIWGGLHWRFSTTAGSRVGERVADHVSKHYFRPRR